MNGETLEGACVDFILLGCFQMEHKPRGAQILVTNIDVDEYFGLVTFIHVAASPNRLLYVGLGFCEFSDREDFISTAHYIASLASMPKNMYKFTPWLSVYVVVATSSWLCDFSFVDVDFVVNFAICISVQI